MLSLEGQEWLRLPLGHLGRRYRIRKAEADGRINLREESKSPTDLELGLRDSSSLVLGPRTWPQGTWGAGSHFCHMHTVPGKPFCREQCSG